MHLKSPCPHCGKRARYSAAEVGLPAVCVACGTRFTLPPPPAADPLDGIPVATPLPAGVFSRPWVWMALAGGLAIGLGIGVVVAIAILREQSPTSVADNGQTTQPQAPPIGGSSAAKPTAAPLADGNTNGSTPANSSNAASSPHTSAPRGAIAMNTQPGGSSLLPNPQHAAPPTQPPVKPAPAGTSSPEVSARPAPQPIPPDADTLTDERIGKAITDGVNFLIAHFDDKTHELKQKNAEFGSFGGGKPDVGGFYGGLDALCVYALLQSGQAIPDKRLEIKSPYMIGLIEQLKKLPDQNGPVTYARALRATALALYARPEDKTALKLDLDWLLKTAQDGAYTYDKITPPRDGPGRFGRSWDNSNSQYGVLGVWSAAEAALEVPSTYWKQVEDHWTKTQLPDGQWSYEGPESEGRLSMTAAGVASLFVTHDWLVAPKFGGNDVGRDPFSPALLKGLNWLEESNHSVNVSASQLMPYTLYGIERVGLASGFKYFGSHDWYRELARQMIDTQKPDGSWGGQEMIETPYVLLFLARGRHPILMNKLRFDGFWANRPRDLANLSRYASKEMETPVNWQVVPLSHNWTDWTDCPILYIASHKPPALTDPDYDNIRSFIQSGGLLFTQSDGDDPEFTKFVAEMSSKLFPTYEMSDLPQDHPLYSVLFHESAKPKLRVVSNGARLLIIHSPVDLARAWQLRQDKVQKTPFEFGLNLFLYASGKHELRNRLQTNIIAAPIETPTYKISIDRLRYAGNWDPEPYAWTRFSRWFQRQTGYGLNVQTVDMADLTPQTAPIAILTGTAAYDPKPAEVDAIKKYVEAGGVLFVDLAGGAGAFEESARTKLFAQAFPSDFFQPLRSDHPLLNPGRPGMLDLTRPKLRSFAVEKLGNPSNEFPSSFAAGKGHVIFTPMDMTCGLLGTYTWGILGYDPDYSQGFLKNMLLWTADGQKDE
jgi:hypothetical protein